MLDGLKNLGAEQKDWDSALRTPAAAWLAHSYGPNPIVDARGLSSLEDKAQAGKVAMICLQGVIVNPLIHLAMMVEGVARLIAGLVVWSFSFIPTSWSETVNGVGKDLLWSGYLGTVGGGTMLVQDVGMIPAWTAKIVAHMWKGESAEAPVGQ